MTTENSLKKQTRRERFIRFAPLFLWVGVIFYLSSTQGATTNTSRFIRPFLEWLFPAAPEETLNIYHGYIRKCAHFAVYAALAFWSWLAFRPNGRTSGQTRFEEFLVRNRQIASFALVVFVASLDEWNQSFNVARTGSVYDILLDASGGAAALLFLWFFTKKQPTTTAF